MLELNYTLSVIYLMFTYWINFYSNKTNVWYKLTLWDVTDVIKSLIFLHYQWFLVCLINERMRLKEFQFPFKMEKLNQHVEKNFGIFKFTTQTEFPVIFSHSLIFPTRLFPSKINLTSLHLNRDQTSTIEDQRNDINIWYYVFNSLHLGYGTINPALELFTNWI